MNLKFFQKLEKFISYTIKLGGPVGRNLDSLRSPNARNKFAFALGERKLLATLKFLYVKLGG
jgi:hypothetical protein